MKKIILISSILAVLFIILLNFNFNHGGVLNYISPKSMYPFVPQYLTTSVLIIAPPYFPNTTGKIIDEGGYTLGNFLLNWSLDLSDNITSYKIYITDNEEVGFNFSNFNVSLPKYVNNYTDTTANQTYKRFYVVRAENEYGSDNNTAVWGKYDINFINTEENKGMNLISIPVQPLNSSIKEVIIQNESNYKISTLYRYNALERKYDVLFYIPSLGGWTTANGQFVSLEPGYSYWVKIKDNITYPFGGDFYLRNVSIQLYNTSDNEGMNLVGWSSIKRTPIKEAIIQSSTNYNITEIYRYNASSLTYDIIHYIPEEDRWTNASGKFTHFEPGYGYWVKTRENMTWLYLANNLTWRS